MARRRAVLFSTGVVDATQGGSGIFNETISQELARRGFDVDIVLRTSAAFRGRTQRREFARPSRLRYVTEADDVSRRDLGITLLEKLHSYSVSKRVIDEFDWDGVSACVSLDLGWALALAERTTPACICILGDPYHRRVFATTHLSAFDRTTWLSVLRAESFRRALPRLRRRLTRFEEDGDSVLASFAPQHAGELRAAGLHCRNARWFAPGPERPVRDPPSDHIRVLHVGDLASSASRSMLRYWEHGLLPVLNDLPFPVELNVVGRGIEGVSWTDRPWTNVTTTFHGHVDDLTGLFREATAFVAPMRYPVGVRTRILTAIAHGVPVVADSSASLGVPELRNGQEIIYADDSREVGDALISLQCDQRRAASVGQSARAAWERFFNPAVNAAALLDLLPELRAA